MIKITRSKPPKGKYAAIKIAFETELEFNLFGSMLNCAPICDAMEKVEPTWPVEYLHDSIQDLGSGIHMHPSSIADALMDAPYVRSRVNSAIRRAVHQQTVK